MLSQLKDGNWFDLSHATAIVARDGDEYVPNFSPRVSVYFDPKASGVQRYDVPVGSFDEACSHRDELAAAANSAGRPAPPRGAQESPDHRGILLRLMDGLTVAETRGDILESLCEAMKALGLPSDWDSLGDLGHYLDMNFVPDEE